MSLTNVHLLFIATAVALAVLCGALAVQQLLTAPSAGALAGLVASGGAVVLLARYEARFLRQSRVRGLR